VVDPISTEERVRRLENWQRDIARELRDWEEWMRLVKPFIEQLQADLVYRQRKHAETVSSWSTSSKITVGLIGVLVGLATIGSFVLQVLHS
jgi:hypothetical protein